MVVSIELQLVNLRIPTLREKLLQELRERRLHRDDLLYRGFSRRMLGEVLEHGSESPNSLFIYANDEQSLYIDPDPRWLNPISYALYGGALAVYRGYLAIPEAYTSYQFPNLETKSKALVAVFSII